MSFTDTLPPGVGFGPISTSGICTETTPGTIECNLGDMATTAPTSTQTVVVHVHMKPTATGTQCNDVVVQSDTPDPDASNDSATACTESTVSGAPEADLTVTKTASPDPVAPGDDLTYTITVTNDGPDDATGVTVTDSLPPGVTFNPGSSSSGCVETTPGTVECNIGNLADGDSITLTIVVTP